MQEKLSRTGPRPILNRRWMKEKDEAIIAYILNNEYYQSCTTYREQCHCLYHIGRSLYLSKNYMARLLNVDHKCFEKQISLPLETTKIGRPSSLTLDEKELIFSEIESMLARSIYPTIKDLQQIIIEKIKKIVSIETIRRLIHESENFKLVTGEPMEEARANISNEVIDAYFHELKEKLRYVPVSLVYNIDEAGEDDFVDTHAFQVIVNKEYESSRISIPVRRETKRATLIHCISADGLSLKPLLIIPRKTVDSSILKKLNCNNLFIKHQAKGFANTDLIKYWIEEIFFPDVEKKLREEQMRSGYNGKAYLILDGFSCHKKAFEQYDLNEKKIELIFLPPHSSHITQPLDLVIFSIQKKLTTTRRQMDVILGQQADCIRRIIQGLEQASTTNNIVAAFENAGIIRTYTKDMCESFNDSMPLARVEKRYSRYFKDNSFTYAMDNWRLDL